MKKLCVIFGGNSPEHDISVITGMQLAKNLKEKYEVEKIYLGLDNKFYLATKIEDLAYFNNKSAVKLKSLVITDGALYVKGFKLKKVCDISCVINCCHGGVGENGDLAGFFAVKNLPHTSACALSAHIAMDKSLTKELVKGVAPVVEGFKVNANNFEEMCEKIDVELGENIIVKPNSMGSSIGVKACTKADYKQQILAIFEMGDEALVENRIAPIMELNQACFKTKDGLMLSAIENPISKSSFLTFDEKYNHNSKEKGQDRIIPAQISADLENLIISHTSSIYNKLNMNGVVRIDYIYNPTTNTLYFNEINTIPGSMAFYLYEPLGIDYISLIEHLVNNPTTNKKTSYFNSSILTKKLL